LTNGKNANAGLTLSPALWHSVVYLLYILHLRSTGFRHRLSGQLEELPWEDTNRAWAFLTDAELRYPSELRGDLLIYAALS
jgi:hypothetical protein